MGAFRRKADYKYENGVKKTIGKSPTVHVIVGSYTKDFCNAKSVTVDKEKLTLAKGESVSVRVTVTGVKKDRKVVAHVRAVRWYSSDANVAKVSRGGKVTAVGKGKCVIYAMANNGKRARVKVTVK